MQPPHHLLRGHTASVSCLASGVDIGSSELLLSGSDDNTVRVWDTRTHKSVRCVKSFDAATSASSSAASDDDAINSVGWLSSHSILVAYGSSLHYIDLRASSSIVIRESTRTMRYNTEEVNAIALNGGRDRIAAPDDAGEVKIVRWSGGEQNTAAAASSSSSAAAASASVATAAISDRLEATLKGHTSLCTHALFRPHSTELWSGGTDCQVLQFDNFVANAAVASSSSASSAAAAYKPRHTFSTQPSASTTSSNSNQTLNPPFVNSMSFTPDGNTLLVGSGNAQVLVYDARKKQEKARFTAHTHSVMHVGLASFPSSFSSISSFTSTTALLTAGNDQTILLWDLDAMLNSSNTTAAASTSTSSSATAAAKNKKKREKLRAKKKLQQQQQSSSSSSTASPNDADENEEDGEEEEIAASLAEASITSPASLSASSPATPSHIFTGSLLSTASLPPSLAFSSLERSTLDTQFVRYRWRHPAKMNSLVSVMDAEKQQSMNGSTAAAGVTIYVADTTNEITAYLIR